MVRRTKIVATLGPACEAPGTLEEMLAAGVDCVRINCSHGSGDELRRRARQARAAAERLGCPLALLFDLQGPKIRLSAATASLAVCVDERVTFVGSEATSPGNGCQVVVELPTFAALVTQRSELVIGDGVPRFAVEEVGDDRVVARALSSGLLSARKGINVTFAEPALPTITEKDEADLALAAEVGVDFVALSFVRCGADIEELRNRLRVLGCTARTIAKIEKLEAYRRLDEIIAVADGVMVARGDYGIEAGVAQVPLMQKDTISRATRAGKVVITATQMLESMIEAPEPTRAEATDVANAVIDGSSAVMLSAETGVGAHPVGAVRAMAGIAQAAEAHEINATARGMRPDTRAACVLHAAVGLAEALDAAALLIPTETGGAARACAKYRTARPIIALTSTTAVANQLMLEWGVRPVVMPAPPSLDALVKASLAAARDLGLPTGAPVVLTAGRKTGTPGATSLIMAREIPA